MIIFNYKISNARSHFSAKKKGFTFLELLVVLAIVGLLAGFSAPFYARFLQQNNVSESAGKTISVLRKAQSYSMSHKDDSDWMVSLSGNLVQLKRASDNAIFDSFTIPSTVSINITSGSFPITFSKPVGQTGQTLALMLSDGSNEISLSVNNQGVVSEE